MSMLKKFLNTTAAISGLIAMSLITTPYAGAAEKRGGGAANASQQSAVGRLKDRIRSNKSAVKPRSSKPAATRSRAVNRVNRPATARLTDRIRTSRSATRATNRSSVRSRSNNSAIINRNSNGIGRVVGNVGREASMIRNRGNRPIVRNSNRNATIVRNRNSNGIGRVVRNVGRDAYNVRNPGNNVVRNRNNRPVAINKNRGYRDYRYRNNRYRGSGFIPNYYSSGLAYSVYNHHNYYDNYYNSNYSVSYGYGYGYPYYGYGPSWGWGTNYYSRPSTRVVYVDRPVETVVTSATPRYIQQPPQQVFDQQQKFEGENCQQVREYTTTIEIGGESVPAYGSACLMPDGSWKFDNPIAEPRY